MPATDIRPLLAVLVGFIACVVILIVGEKNRDIREGITFGAAISKFLILISLFPLVYEGGKYLFTTPELLPGISLSFMADPFSLFFSTLSSMLWIVTTMFSIGYMRGLHEHKQTRYYAAFAACIGATIGIANSANLFTLFVFYEILTVATYPLVIHDEDEESLAAGRKYLAYTLTGGIFILFSLVLTYDIAGTLNFANTGLLSASMASPLLLKLLFATFIIGFGVKAAIMPLHSWLPSVMVAPTPVSALLHCVAVVKAGTFGIIRVVNNVYGIELMGDLGLGLPLVIVASITIIISMLIALTKDHLKARLAYSTINELSYIVLGAGLLTEFGVTGSMVHIANHAFMKIGMFFFAGTVFVATGKEYISEMDGIGKRMPISTLVFSIGAIALTGTPPLVGFISKWYLALGAIQSPHPVFVGVLLASALLNVAVFWPIIYKAFFKEPEVKRRPKVSLWLMIPMVFASFGTIVLGLFPRFPYTPLELAFRAVRLFLGG
ncbi:cation:proton antiporter [archaeon SCG-AAA382B04]|nr:cation:proton antiporter [archaeon SCG-AAA382B04]